jgi:hypothetical protein
VVLLCSRRALVKWRAWDAPCIGDAERNSIYGDGIVDALRAVQGGRHNHD